VRNRNRSSSSSGESTPHPGTRRRLKPREYDGTTPFETFIEQFNNCAIYNRWREVDKLAYLKACLTKVAGQLLWDSAPTETDTFQKLNRLMRNRFGGTQQMDKNRMELRLRRRQPGETLGQLHQDIRRLKALAHPTLNAEQRDAIAIDHFVDALNDAEFSLKVRERAPASLDNALRVAVQLEAWYRDATRQRSEQKLLRSRVVDVNVDDAVDEGDAACAKYDSGAIKLFSDRLNKLETRLESALNALHAKPQPQSSTGSSTDSLTTTAVASRGRPASRGRLRNPVPRPLFCWNCDAPGHIKRNCPFPVPMVTPAPTSAIQAGPQPQIQPQGNQTVKAQQPDSFVGGLKGIKEPIYLPMELKGRRYMCLLDSGCDHTLVPQSLVERLRNLSVRPTNRRLRSVQDIELDIIGKVTLPMELGGRTIPTEALVSPDVQEFLLGNDWLTEHQCL